MGTITLCALTTLGFLSVVYIAIDRDLSALGCWVIATVIILA
jgi:hypothetical protein